MRIFAGWRVRAGIKTSTLRVGAAQSGSTRTSAPDASSAATSGCGDTTNGYTASFTVGING